MSILYQRNRNYSLVVGTQQEAIEFNGLQIRFRVTKTSNNRDKRNQARVDIYNLSREHQALLEERYVTVQLKVGYEGAMAESDELLTLFTGQVVDLQVNSGGGMYNSTRSGTDIITTLTVDELFTEMNGRQISQTIPAGKKVRDVILALVAQIPEITRHEMGGEGIEREVPDGYPMVGTPRQILDDLSKTYNLDCQVDNSVLYVSDRGGTFTKNTISVPVLGEFSGLIERPEFKSQDPKRVSLKGDEKKATGKKNTKNTQPKEHTIHLKVLMNPAIIAGGLVKVVWGEIDGFYKVDEVMHEGDFRGTDWYSKLILSAKEV